MDDVAASSPPRVPLAGSMPPTGRQARWWRRFGWTMAGIWLAFLADPFQEAALNPDRWAGALAMAALLSFALVYLRPWLPYRRRESSLGFAARVPGREAARDLAVLVVLALLTLPGAGLDGLTTTVFICTYALFVLPLRWALPPCIVLMSAFAVVGHLVPGASALVGVAEGGFFACIATFGFSRMALRSVELAAAQQDLARLAVAEERSRFSRDLHDLLGHSLTVVTLKAELAGRLLEADNDTSRARAAAEVADIERLARDALSDVRAALEGYREVSLGTELAGARQALAAAGISAQLPGAVDDVPPAFRELFGWVVREGVTNVVRHSGASRCWVEVSPTEVAVCDDGRGPADSTSTSPGSGLRGLDDRSRAAGAVLLAGRSPSGGFSLRVRTASAGSRPLLAGAGPAVRSDAGDPAVRATSAAPAEVAGAPAGRAVR